MSVANLSRSMHASNMPPYAEPDIFDIDMAKDAVINKLYSNYLIVFLIKSGSMELKSNLRNFTFIKNSLVFVSPSMAWEITGISEDCDLKGMIFTPDYLMNSGATFTSNELLNFFTGNYEPSVLLSADEELNISMLLDFIHNKIFQRRSGYANPSLRYAFLTLMFESDSIVKIKNIVPPRAKLVSGEDVTLRFLKLVAAHCKQERSVQFYADSMHITTRHLSHVVKEVTGKTAGQIIDDAVIMEAKALLADISKNISQVADMLNFSNVTFFSKFFKKRVGMNPSEFRNLL